MYKYLRPKSYVSTLSIQDLWKIYNPQTAYCKLEINTNNKPIHISQKCLQWFMYSEQWSLAVTPVTTKQFYIYLTLSMFKT